MRLTIFLSLLSFFMLSCTAPNTITPKTIAVQKPLPIVENIPENTIQPTATATETVNITMETTMLLPTPEPIAPEPTPVPLPGIELFNFAGGELGWYTVDDNVMGGVSSSSVSLVEPSQLSFSGNMSLDNNGGFSSVRSDLAATNLSDFDGVLLRVLGDGKTYRLRIRAEETGAGISYNATFKTTADNWELFYLPFADMVPTYRGFVMDVGQLDTTAIRSFGFMLTDKQPGEFELQVDWMRAVSEEELETLASY